MQKKERKHVEDCEDSGGVLGMNNRMVDELRGTNRRQTIGEDREHTIRGTRRITEARNQKKQAYGYEKNVIHIYKCQCRYLMYYDFV